MTTNRLALTSALVASITTGLPTATVAQLVPRADSAFVTPIEVPGPGGATLRGELYVAAGSGLHATVVHLQGFPGGRSTELEQYFQDQGFNVASVYVRGQQSSDGLYSVSGMPDDALAIAAFLRTDSARRRFRIDPDRITLLGGSAGSFGALQATSADSALRCVAAIVPFNWGQAGFAARRDTALVRQYRSTIANLTSRPQAPIRTDTSFVTTIIRDAELHDLRRAAASLAGRKVFLVGAENDDTAPLAEHFRPVVEAARTATGAVVRDTIVTDTHMLSATNMQVLASIASWLRRECGS